MLTVATCNPARLPASRELTQQRGAGVDTAHIHQHAGQQAVPLQRLPVLPQRPLVVAAAGIVPVGLWGVEHTATPGRHSNNRVLRTCRRCVWNSLPQALEHGGESQRAACTHLWSQQVLGIRLQLLEVGVPPLQALDRCDGSIRGSGGSGRVQVPAAQHAAASCSCYKQHCGSIWVRAIGEWPASRGCWNSAS